MADAGCDDILVSFNIVGPAKLERLRRLLERVAVTVSVDDAALLAGLAGAAGAASRSSVSSSTATRASGAPVSRTRRRLQTSPPRCRRTTRFASTAS